MRAHTAATPSTKRLAGKPLQEYFGARPRTCSLHLSRLALENVCVPQRQQFFPVCIYYYCTIVSGEKETERKKITASGSGESGARESRGYTSTVHCGALRVHAARIAHTHTALAAELNLAARLAFYPSIAAHRESVCTESSAEAELT